MFADISPDYLVASVFFLTSGCYLYLCIVTVTENTKSQMRNDYLSAGACLVIYSLCYGLMTIAKNDALIRILWAVGFAVGCLFFTRWLLFSFDLISTKQKNKRLLFYAASGLAVIVSGLCILSNDTVFVRTRYGVQFSYQNSPLFIATSIYLTIIIFVFLYFNFRRWRGSEIKRERIQSLLFIILSAIIAPIGFAADFIVPAFTSFTAIPLASICFLPASMPFFLSIRKHKTLSITVPNASGYVFNTVTIPTLVLDHKNVIRLENKAVLDFFDCSVVGKNIAEIILSNGKEPEKAFFCKDIVSEKVTVETPRGDRICDMLLAVENDKYNDVLCKVVLLRDITENEHKDDMLQAALEHANIASRAKSDFLSNMSHEIRTPMNAIIGMTKIGLSTSDKERKDYSFQKISDASAHLLGVINDILDMSKIEAGKYELSDAEFNFEKMLQQVVNVVNFRVEEKKQKLTVYIDRDIPQLLVGDNQRFAQVITNLISNAVKFTPEEGAISLHTYLLEEKNGLCRIKVSVTDTGIGISKEQQAKLFQAFTQAENDTSRKFGGTGLGLTISKNIVEMMDGEIWVESELGKGATFAFAVQVKCGGKASRAAASHEQHRTDLRILAVDDDAYILKDLKGILEKLGVSCDTAANGEEALLLAQQNGGYHLCFLDWNTPDIGGIELTAELKKRSSVSDDSFVMITSTAEYSAFVGEAKEAGINKFLQKPLFPTAIAEIIDEFLGRTKQGVDQSVDIPLLFEGSRILLAEDVEINCEIVKSLLEPMLLEVDCAMNGAQAVRMFAEAPDNYDMIFMDIQMPELDGYEATRRIRALDIEEAKNIPIIAMTANVFKEDIEKCFEAGMNGHVCKPVDFDEVISQLRKYLSM